jgi:hypothetical protein
MTEIKVVKSDKGYDLNFTLQKSDGTALDLTGATLLLKVQKYDASAVKFSGSMAITNPPGTDGKCKYTVQATDFDVAGKYNGEIEVSYGTSQILTFTDILIEVLEELPK